MSKHQVSPSITAQSDLWRAQPALCNQKKYRKGKVIQCWNNSTWLDSKWTLYLFKSTQKEEQEEAGTSPCLEARGGGVGSQKAISSSVWLRKHITAPCLSFLPVLQRLQHYLLASSIFWKDFSANTSEMVGVPLYAIKVYITVKKQFVKNNSDQTVEVERRCCFVQTT